MFTTIDLLHYNLKFLPVLYSISYFFILQSHLFFCLFLVYNIVIVFAGNWKEYRVGMPLYSVTACFTVHLKIHSWICKV